MTRLFFMCSVIFCLGFAGCNNDEPEAEESETCIEGWVENEEDDGIYYRKCPTDLTKCTKTLKMFINVVGNWQEGPGLLIIRNISDDHTEEIRREHRIYRHRYDLKMIIDRSRNYRHEITLELPSNNCLINGQSYSYTYSFDIPCDGFEHVTFDICKEIE